MMSASSAWLLSEATADLSSARIRLTAKRLYGRVRDLCA